MTFTSEQIDAVKRGEPVLLVPEELGEEVVVLRRDIYRLVAELIDDWDPQTMRQHMAQLMRDDWADPAMNVYDE